MIEKSEGPLSSPHPCLILLLLSLLYLSLSPCSELASGLSEVLPEEFLDLCPGVLLGCSMRSRVPSPEQGLRKGVILAPGNGVIKGSRNGVNTGSIAQGCIGRLQKVACPRVEQHPSIVSPVALQLLQGLLSKFFAIDRLVILSYNEEDLTLGLFNWKHAPLIQLLPGVPPVVEEAHSP